MNDETCAFTARRRDECPTDRVNISSRLAQAARRVAQETAGEAQASPYLWGVAIEALDWLRHAPAEERERALEALTQCLETRGASAGITLPADSHAARCLITLLLFVHNPPRAL